MRELTTVMEVHDVMGHVIYHITCFQELQKSTAHDAQKCEDSSTHVFSRNKQQKNWFLVSNLQ